MAGEDRAVPPDDSKNKGPLFSGALMPARAAILSMRPIQWSKSILVFLPLAFSIEERWSFDDLELGGLFLRVLAGMIIFCALSGAIYIVNDIFDRERDRIHPRKRTRPIASGKLPIPAAQTTVVLLVAVSLVGAFLLGTGFGIVCLAYIAMNLAYSSFLKNVIILDVMIVGAGYLLRVVAGALIIDVSISPWLYTTIGLGALFIALGKRYSELKAAGNGASGQRVVLEEYSQVFLGQLISITGTAALVAYALYTFTASNVPENHSMMLTVPFVIFGLFRYLYLINHTDQAESPELVIIRDLPLMVAVVAWAVTAIVVLAVSR